LPAALVVGAPALALPALPTLALPAAAAPPLGLLLQATLTKQESTVSAERAPVTPLRMKA
jgi:hypothetical protein